MQENHGGQFVGSGFWNPQLTSQSHRFSLFSADKELLVAQGHTCYGVHFGAGHLCLRLRKERGQ